MHPSRRATRIAFICTLALLLLAPVLPAAQRTVRITSAQVALGANGRANAYLTVENGTMYEVYLVGVRSDAAATAELVQVSAGKTDAVKEVPIPAFDRLEMSPDSVFVQLTGIKGELAAGQTVRIVLSTDVGEELSVDAAVKP